LIEYQEWLLKHWHLSTSMIDIQIMTVAVQSCMGTDGEAMHIGAYNERGLHICGM